MAKFDLENLTNIVNRSNNSSQESSIRKIDKILSTLQNSIQDAEYQKIKTMSGFNLWGSDARSSVGFGVKNAEKAFSDAMDKFVKTISDKNAKFEDVLEAQLSLNRKEVAVKAAEAQKQQIIQKRQAFVGQVFGAVGAVGDIIGSATDFMVKRQQQRHDSSRFINDMYLSGMHAMQNWDYVGMMKAAAYMSPEAANFGRTVGSMDQAGRVLTAGAKVAGGAIAAAVGGPIGWAGGTALGLSAISDITDIISGATFDSATLTREARSKYAETMYQKNRIRWETIKAPKLAAFEVMGHLEYRSGQRGSLGWAREEQYHLNRPILDRLGVGEVPLGIPTQERLEARLEHQQRQLKNVSWTKELPTFSEPGMEFFEYKGAVREAEAKREKLSLEISENKKEVEKAFPSRFSKLMGDYSYLFGGDFTKTIAEAGAGAGFAAGRFSAAQRSTLAAMSQGVIASGRQYAEVSGTLGAFTANAQNAADMFLGQLVGRATPEMTSEITKAISSVGQHVAARGLGVGTAPATLMMAAMGQKSSYGAFDVNRARTAIEDVDRRLTSGKLDMGKVIASSTLSKAGIGGQFQQALFTLSSAEIMEIQRAANKGPEEFENATKRLNVYGVSRDQWLSNNIAGTLTSSAYATAGIVLGLSPEAMALLGKEGYLDPEQRQKIWKNLSETEKATLTTTVGRMGGAIDAISGVTGGGIGGEERGGISGQGRGQEALRKLEREGTLEQQAWAKLQLKTSELAGERAEGATFESISKELQPFLDSVYGKGQMKTQEYLAAQAGGQTFGFVTVNTMHVVNYRPKTGS